MLTGVGTLLWGALIGVGVIVASWAVMIVLARRRPPAWRRILPPSVLSPIDLIPEFLPVIGPLDDVVVVALVFRNAARQMPRVVLFEAWLVDPRILQRLVPASRPNV